MPALPQGASHTVHQVDTGRLDGFTFQIALQFVPKIPRCSIPTRRFLLEPFHADGFQVARHILIE